MDNNTAAPTPTPEPGAANEAIIGDPKPATEVVADAPIVEAPKRKMKWGDTEKEVSFEEAVQLAQKAWGIEEKAKANASKLESAEKLLHMLQNDPKGFAKQAKKAGLDPTKLATEILYDNIQTNSLSPEQRELNEYKEKEAEALAVKQAEDDLKKAQEVDAKTKEWSTGFEKQLEDALKTQKMPKSRLALAITAKYIDDGLKEKKNYTVEQVLPFVLRDLKQVHADTIGKLDGEDLLNYLGEEATNKVAKARVARYTKGKQQTPPPAAKPAKTEKQVDIKKLKGKEYWNALRRMKSEQGIGAHFE